MDGAGEDRFDLSVAKATASDAAREWGLELGEPFAFSHASYVAPAGDAVLKVAWEGDDESLHEGDALALWDGDGAVRLRRRSGRALLEDRAVPGDDLSAVPEDEATAIAVDVAARLWRPAGPPFRPVAPEVSRWLDRAEGEGSDLVRLARDLLASLDPPATVARARRLSPSQHPSPRRAVRRHRSKPYLADREFDLPSFLWNPLGNRMGDRKQTERRIAAFVNGGSGRLSDPRLDGHQRCVLDGPLTPTRSGRSSESLRSRNRAGDARRRNAHAERRVMINRIAPVQRRSCCVRDR